jgi:hypothetical protein
MVSMTVAKAAIAEVIEQLTRDMDIVKPGVWAMPLSAEHRAMLSVQAYKGGTVELEYGVSCRWVPHLEGKRWRWHTTLKQSRRDLWVDHFTLDAPPRNPISQLHGLEHLRKQAEMARDAVTPLARRWWDSVATAQGVLTEALRQEPARGVVLHWPHPSLVAAFSMARLGDIEAGAQHLAEAGRLDEPLLTGALERISELERTPH